MKDKLQIGIASLLLAGIVVGGAIIPAPPEGEKYTLNFDFSEESLTDLANQISTDLTLRQYNNVTSHFADNVAEALSIENLEINWLYVAGSIGKFQEIDSTIFSINEDSINVQVTLNYDSRAVVINYSFDQNSKIVGLWFRNALLEPVAEETPVFYEEVIQVGHNDNKMNGLITIPKGVENPPVVVLVHGSGTHDLNESIGVNHPFYDIAHGLAEYGIATIRYDKRHAVYPNELPDLINANNFTIEDEVTDDVDSIIKEIAGGKFDVDNDQIYILGHSLGGMLAPKIATENPEVTGIISMAGSLRLIEDIILTQNEESIASMDGLSDEDKVMVLAQINEQVGLIKSFTAESAEIVMGYPASYWYSYQTLDNMNVTKNLDIPVLVLQGTEDFQISVDIDLPLWVDALSENPKATAIIYDGLNHLMMPSSGLRNIGDYDIEGNVSSDVISDIASFINNPPVSDDVTLETDETDEVTEVDETDTAD